MLISYNRLYPYDTAFHHHELGIFIYDDRFRSQTFRERARNPDKCVFNSIQK